MVSLALGMEVVTLRMEIATLEVDDLIIGMEGLVLGMVGLGHEDGRCGTGNGRSGPGNRGSDAGDSNTWILHPGQGAEATAGEGAALGETMPRVHPSAAAYPGSAWGSRHFPWDRTQPQVASCSSATLHRFSFGVPTLRELRLQLRLPPAAAAPKKTDPCV